MHLGVLESPAAIPPLLAPASLRQSSQVAKGSTSSAVIAEAAQTEAANCSSRLKISDSRQTKFGTTMQPIIVDSVTIMANLNTFSVQLTNGCLLEILTTPIPKRR